MMVSFKSLLVAGLTSALLLATVVAAQVDPVPEEYVADTTSTEGGAAKRSPSTSLTVPIGSCPAFQCGTYTKTVWAKVYYSWYTGINLSVGSVVSDGGRVAFPCRMWPWCPGCYRCIVYKWIRTRSTVPKFCCPLPRILGPATVSVA
eukprot:TRINITY_DN131_c0_g1_i1.p2 TRINITY_DN131_c0_g1~~TRINITY_DN131_c0_g1_i1.p2  ORF type:complete len:147 (+),score=19.72 TRINITY_DN131_c0_g1_i1:226-666(+)